MTTNMQAGEMKGCAIPVPEAGKWKSSPILLVSDRLLLLLLAARLPHTTVVMQHANFTVL
jgi:hypothetical protein